MRAELENTVPGPAISMRNLSQAHFLLLYHTTNFPSHFLGSQYRYLGGLFTPLPAWKWYITFGPFKYESSLLG